MTAGVAFVGRGRRDRGMRKVRRGRVCVYCFRNRTKHMAKHVLTEAGPGRPKGIPNKITLSVKEAIEKAFEKLGGQEYLVHVGQTDPRTFCALLSKLLPTKIANADGSPILSALTALTDAELEARTALALAQAQRSGVLPAPSAPLLEVQAEVVSSQSEQPEVDATQGESEGV